MKNILGYIAVVLLVVSCSKPVSAEDLNHLNGYWEISEVKTPEGDAKTYQSNNNIDYFILENQGGTRAKVVPQLDGTIQTNGFQENFVLKDSVNSTYLFYQTEYSKWAEKIDKLTADELILINENNIKYTYKRFTPIIIDINE